MKIKYILAFALIMGLPTASFACQSGTEFTDTNGKHFCYSDIDLNWWSAFTWCSAQGYHLAGFHEACPGKAVGTTACGNLNNGIPWNKFWTTAPSGSTAAYRVQPYHNGPSASVNRSDDSAARALCVMP